MSPMPAVNWQKIQPVFVRFVKNWGYSFTYITIQADCFIQG